MQQVQLYEQALRNLFKRAVPVKCLRLEEMGCSMVPQNFHMAWKTRYHATVLYKRICVITKEKALEQGVFRRERTCMGQLFIVR